MDAFLSYIVSGFDYEAPSPGGLLCYFATFCILLFCYGVLHNNNHRGGVGAAGEHKYLRKNNDNDGDDSSTAAMVAATTTLTVEPRSDYANCRKKISRQIGGDVYYFLLRTDSRYDKYSIFYCPHKREIVLFSFQEKYRNRIFVYDAAKHMDLKRTIRCEDDTTRKYLSLSASMLVDKNVEFVCCCSCKNDDDNDNCCCCCCQQIYVLNHNFLNRMNMDVLQLRNSETVKHISTLYFQHDGDKEENRMVKKFHVLGRSSNRNMYFAVSYFSRDADNTGVIKIYVQPDCDKLSSTNLYHVKTFTRYDDIVHFDPDNFLVYFVTKRLFEDFAIDVFKIDTQRGHVSFFRKLNLAYSDVGCLAHAPSCKLCDYRTSFYNKFRKRLHLYFSDDNSDQGYVVSVNDDV